MVMTKVCGVGVVCAVALAVGCQTPVDTRPTVGTYDPDLGPGGTQPRVTISHPELVQVLGFQDPIVVEDDGLLEVIVPVRNLSPNRYTIDYRFFFYDEDGRELSYSTGYQEIWIEAKEQRRVSAKAVDERAVDYRAHFKWANR